MKYKETLGYFKRRKQSIQLDDVIQVFEDVAIEALEKQIPRISGCYICNDTSNSRYYENQKYQYCPYCGQKIKWD